MRAAILRWPKVASDELCRAGKRPQASAQTDPSLEKRVPFLRIALRLFNISYTAILMPREGKMVRIATNTCPALRTVKRA